MGTSEQVARKLYEAKDAIQYALDHWPEGANGTDDLEEALERVGRAADEVDPTLDGTA